MIGPNPQTLSIKNLFHKCTILFENYKKIPYNIIEDIELEIIYFQKILYLS